MHCTIVALVLTTTPSRNADPYFTSFHFQPLAPPNRLPEGIVSSMNDPNGPFYDESTKLYHLFVRRHCCEHTGGYCWPYTRGHCYCWLGSFLLCTAQRVQMKAPASACRFCTDNCCTVFRGRCPHAVEGTMEVVEQYKRNWQNVCKLVPRGLEGHASLDTPPCSIGARAQRLRLWRHFQWLGNAGGAAAAG